MFRNFAIVGACLMILGGCTSKYRVDAYTPPNAHLATNASFYVSLPENGSFESHPYPDSGAQTAEAFRAALLVHVTKVEIGTVNGEDTASALQQARQRHLTYVAQAIILHWEDRATEWSGKPDRITLKLSIYDATTGTIVSTGVTAASSKWATMGGDHPQDLLPEPMKRFVDPLF